MSLTRDGFVVYRRIFSAQGLDDLRSLLKGHLSPNDPGNAFSGTFSFRQGNSFGIQISSQYYPVSISNLFDKTAEANWPLARHQGEKGSVDKF